MTSTYEKSWTFLRIFFSFVQKLDAEVQKEIVSWDLSLCQTQSNKCLETVIYCKTFLSISSQLFVCTLWRTVATRAWINNPVSRTALASVPWVGAGPGVSRPPPAGTTPQSHRRIFRIKDDFCKRICKWRYNEWVVFKKCIFPTSHTPSYTTPRPSLGRHNPVAKFIVPDWRI
jgi:hypothetical protein